MLFWRCLVSLLVVFPVAAVAAPPITRLGISLNGAGGTATSVEGTNYDYKTGGFGIEAFFSLVGLFGGNANPDEPSALSYVSPVFGATLDANITSPTDPCHPSAFDPNTLECEHIGDPVRGFGVAKVGLRGIIPSDGKLGPVGITIGGQYLIHGLYTTDSAGEDNAILPYAQLEYAKGDQLLTVAGGLGGYVMVEYATKKRISIASAVAIRIERMGWERSESVVRGIFVHLMVGLIDF